MSVTSGVGETIGETRSQGIWRRESRLRSESARQVSVVLTGDGIALEDPQRNVRYFVAKRALDVLVAFVGLLLALPFLVVAAAAIKLDSPGPVFFSQERLRGHRRRKGDGYWWMVEPFRFYKLRTMSDEASAELHQSYITAFMEGDEGRIRSYLPEPSPASSYKMTQDPRVTRVGRFLRKLSLDEVPQLWNVLKGDMSLVGPRPHLAYEVSMYNGNHLLRLASPPGITGLSQVKARALAPFETMVDYDLEYVRKRSIALDLVILFRTIPVVLSRRGAG